MCVCGHTKQQKRSSIQAAKLPPSGGIFTDFWVPHRNQVSAQLSGFGSADVTPIGTLGATIHMNIIPIMQIWHMNTHEYQENEFRTIAYVIIFLRLSIPFIIGRDMISQGT